MKRIKEKNIAVFNKDITKTGSYQYTSFDKYSAYIATKRQSDELIVLLLSRVGKNATILDVGCGDGTFTYELYQRVKPKKILGFDNAQKAIQAARKLTKAKNDKIIFQTIDIYNAHKKFKKNSFDIIVIRGVLHHLYNPQLAIKSLSFLSKKIIVLEPNGYNPLLKVIEKVSPYHKEHEERSYWPPSLNSWFIKEGFLAKEQRFFSIIPYFCPDILVTVLKAIQPVMENIPFFKLLYCGTNLIYYEKK